MDSMVKDVANIEPSPIENIPTTITNSNDLLGYWVGIFEAIDYKENVDFTYTNKINVSLDNIDIATNKVKGHSVVGGNYRPFEGSIKEEKEKYVIQAKEDGTDKNDGIFQIEITKEKPAMTGNWTAYDSKLPVTKREIQQSTKKVFRYDPTVQVSENLDFYPVKDTKHKAKNDEIAMAKGDFLKWNASTTLLQPKNIENFKRGDLQILRNSIYARHGYAFKNRIVREVFEMQEWYIPVSADVTKDLTELEKKNAELIKKYEKHAVEYYDSFGR